jgi:muramoyltetrapeptide carboxypeptidase
VIGSSDFSYILWNLMDSHLLVVFYGPMAYSSLAEGQYDRESLVSCLMGEGAERRYPGTIVRKGFSDAVITGGCLSNLVSLIGTQWFPQIEERILLLEDINERPYRIDRMLWQLKMTGVFEKISGLMLGEFPGCFKDEEERAFFFHQLNRYLEGTDYPVVSNLPLGHSTGIGTIPLGINGKIITDEYEGIVLNEQAVTG